jgi:hypothetical protein
MEAAVLTLVVERRSLSMHEERVEDEEPERSTEPALEKEARRSSGEGGAEDEVGETERKKMMFDVGCTTALSICGLR